MPLPTPRRYRCTPTLGAASVAALAPAGMLRVVSWNLQFCGGRAQPFFYEGGSRVRVPRSDQDRAFAGVVEVLRGLNADVVLLQELDRGSARTDHVDQLARLLNELPGYAAVSAAMHKNRFVPYPWPPLGRINLHLATLSRAVPSSPLRLALPGLREPRLRAHFNLHRALLAAQLPLANGEHLAVGNTHLSAFSGGDDTLARQVRLVDGWLGNAGSTALLGGDFNVLPPGDDASRLATDRDDHPTDRAEIDAFFAAHPSVLDPVGQLRPEAGTYLPPGASAPDRTLDWVFTGEGLRTVRAWVEPVDPFVSDHWPVVADLALV